MPRSAMEQLLTTGAIDPALAMLDWPDLTGKAVELQLGAPEEAFDRRWTDVTRFEQKRASSEDADE
jgi:hypothetical protein